MNDLMEMKELLVILIKEVRQMALDFSKLDAQVTAAVSLLNQLAAQIAAIPPSQDPVTQAHIDGLTSTLATAVAADTPTGPTGGNGSPAPTGTTGPTGG